jgi:hypothetical protein
MPVNKWYPNPGEDQHTVNRNLTDLVYHLQSQIEGMKSSPAATPEATNTPNGPSNTKINGLYVTASLPKNADTIRYDAATGQFKFAP